MSVERRPGAGRLGAWALLALLPHLALACSSPAEPTDATYSIAFPSVAAAASTDAVEIYLHDGEDPGACQDLTLKRITKQALPEHLAALPATTPCEILSGQGPKLEITYGPRALLVVGRRGGEDFVIGCTRFDATDEAFEVAVTLTLAGSNVAPPSSSCATLSDKCENAC